MSAMVESMGAQDYSDVAASKLDLAVAADRANHDLEVIQTHALMSIASALVSISMTLGQRS